MNTFSYLFLAALALSVLLQLWLALRQRRHVLTHRAAVPEAFRDTVTPEDHRKAADYTAAKLKLGNLELGYSTVLLLVWTLGGGLQWLDGLWRATGLDPLWAGLGVLISFALIGGLLDLPFALYRTFVLEARFGFNRTTLKLFVADLIKGTLLTLIIGGPIALLALWLMGAAGALWWLWVWAVWSGFSLFMMWAYPVFIAPLFNRFEAMEEGPLRERIEALLQRCGFQSNGLFVMDGSKRSAHGNAYFTGFGRNKRIVFFDTLLNGLDGDEVEAVLAHELGHFKLRHVAKRLAFGMALTLAALALLGWLADQLWFYQGLGIDTPSNHMALLLFMLVIPLLGPLLQPVSAQLSRRHEFQADDYAAEQADAGALVSALLKLYKENASTLTPDPLYAAFHYSHPPAVERIGNLRK